MLRQSGDGTAAVSSTLHGRTGPAAEDIHPGDKFEVVLHKQNGTLGLNVTVSCSILLLVFGCHAKGNFIIIKKCNLGVKFSTLSV